MRKTPYKTWLLAGFLLLMPSLVHAAGLGKLTVLSALGQPLLAEVDLVSVQTGELATLVARLARSETYTQANISFSPALVGVRMSIERRADGQPYIKIISTRPVNDLFIDLLVELSWPQGRLVREYSALIDPIEYTPRVSVAPSVAVTPPVTPEPQPIARAPQPPVAAVAPVEAKPAAAPARPVKPPVAAAAGAAEKAYGPVKRGETLARIASRVKPEGVTLEQMLVSLYHTNPEAFAGNMNYLKVGKILRVPEKERVIATSQSEAAKEVRVEAANWNVYRQKLAEAAGETPARGSKSAASGKITTKVDDKAADKAAPKEVLKLSKGELAAGKASAKDAPDSVTNRIRTLEEEVITHEKALAEANNLIAQLEKTLKDMQRVTEIKAQAPVAKPAPKPPSPAPEPDLIAQIMGEPVYLAAGGGVLALLAVGGYLFVRRRRAQAGSDESTGEKIEPEIGKKTAAAGGGILALLGGYFAARRRAQAGAGDAVRERIAPEFGEKAAATAVTTAAAASSIATRAAGGEADVDPLAEADMYLNFGRDAQAEEVLKEALEKTPGHEEVQLKLLQIYAGRKDKAAFEKIARSLHAQTGGTGDNWVKAAAMGYAFDSANTLYEAGKPAPVADVATTDFLSSPATEADTMVTLRPGEAAVAADAQPLGEPGPTRNVRGDEAAGAQVSGDAAAPMSNVIDFQFDTAPAPVSAAAADDGRGSALDGASVPVTEAEAVPPPTNLEFKVDFERDKLPASGARPEAAQQPAVAGGDGVPMLEPDFRLDLNAGGEATAAAEGPALKLDEISLNFEEGPGAVTPPAESGTRDDHWHDVQTKFDLAKAYQEMGEKGGAREILQEVIKEGDAGQRAAAQKLLESLD